MEFLTSNISLLGGGGATAVILFVLKKIPNEKIYDNVFKVIRSAGVVVTLGLGKWNVTKKYWKVVEEWLIDALNNVILSALNGFVEGLRSDDQK